eukprot:COSAG04_NODE_5864_length_1468_cov_9.029218_2_plen_149_part_00
MQEIGTFKSEHIGEPELVDEAELAQLRRDLRQSQATFSARKGQFVASEEYISAEAMKQGLAELEKIVAATPPGVGDGLRSSTLRGVEDRIVTDTDQQDIDIDQQDIDIDQLKDVFRRAIAAQVRMPSPTCRQSPRPPDIVLGRFSSRA